MHLLPLSLARLAEHADRPGWNAAFVTDAVFLQLNGDNTFEAVATNTKTLVRVTGPCVAVRMSAYETSLGVTDGENPWWESARNREGRFPQYEDVIAKALAAPASEKFTVDPQRLGQLLKTAAEFCPKFDGKVEIQSHAGNTPVTMRCALPGGLEFFGLVMPLVADSMPQASLDTDRMSLAEENASLRAERDELAREVALLKASLANLQ